MPGTFTTWLWKTHERTTTLGLQQATTDANIAELKGSTAAKVEKLETEQRELRDAHVGMDTQLGAVMTAIGKWDRIDANTEVTKATVERLDKQVIPREALEARFRAIEERLT